MSTNYKFQNRENLFREPFFSNDYVEPIGKMWLDVQKVFDNLFGFENSVLWLIDESGAMIDPLPYNVEDSAMNEYIREAYKYDPLHVDNLPPSLDAIFISTDDLMTAGEYRKSDYYKDYASKYGIDNHVGRLLVYYGNELLGFVGISNDRRFSESEIRRLVNLAPLLGNTIMLNYVSNGLKNENALLSSYIANSNSGFILLDANDRILQINRAACELHNRYALDSSLDKFAISLIDQNSSITIFLRFLGYIIDIVDAQERKHSRKRSRMICIYSVTEIDKMNVITDTTKKLSTLTETEMIICNDLYKGLSYKGISEKNYISISTVNKHASSIYEKLEVKNRNMLQSVLNQL